MVYCCVPFCKSRSGRTKGVSFHDFPLDPVLKKKWLIVIARKNFMPNTNAYCDGVCSLHFRDTDYKPGKKIRCLKPNSIPSVFPNYPPDYPSLKFFPKLKTPAAVPITKKNPSFSIKDTSKAQASGHRVSSVSVSPGCENKHVDSIRAVPFSISNPSYTTKDTTRVQAFRHQESSVSVSPVCGNKHIVNVLAVPVSIKDPSFTTTDTSKVEASGHQKSLVSVSPVCENEHVGNISSSPFSSKNMLKDAYSQTTFNIHEVIFKLKRQNSCLRSKVYKCNEKLSQLQSCLNIAQEKIIQYEKKFGYLPLH